MRREFMAQSLVRQAEDLSVAGGPHARAVQLAAWAVQLAPDDFPVQRVATNVFLRGRAWDRALLGLQAAQLKTAAPDPFQLGSCYLHLGQEAKAVALLESFLAAERSLHRTGRLTDRQWVMVLNDVGYTYADVGVRLAEALELTREAARLAPTDGMILDSLAWAHYRLGQYDQAAFAVERALRLERRPDPEILYHAGVIHARLGRLRLARSELRRAIQLRRDDFPEASDEIRRLRWQLPPPETV